MTKKNQTTESNEVATTQQFSINQFAFEALEEKPMNELICLTSNLVKMEEGEQLICFVHNETENLTNQDGENYECQVLTNKDGEKLLIADVVVLSNFKRLFEKEPTITGVYAKIICKGERKAATGNNKYKDFQIGILKA